ncbi:MAG: cupin domain-containing protein [Gammaproteobacteria bacterium]|nr:cupin domain-containing protein [Gammaproteobacteria bacterium]
MSINHHLNKDTLLAYSAGTLYEGFSFLAKAHLHYCKTCQHQLDLANHFAGNLLEKNHDSMMNDNSFNQLWDKIQSKDASSDASKAIIKEIKNDFSLIINNNYDDIPWSVLVPGIQQYIFTDIHCDQGSVRLLKIKSGIQIPHHSHNGTELTLILKGSYEDESGEYYPGDLSDLDDSNCHQPHVNSTEDCICLIATEQKLKFSSPFNRLLQVAVGL